MAEQHRPDDLAQLRARLDAQETEIARLKRHRRPRRFLPLALVGLLVALLPLSILAAGPFGDLNAGRDAANADIQAIADVGITKGCNPPDFTNYCPNDLVTREQMASFLARTAGLGGNPPIANAARLAVAAPAAGGPTYAANELVRVARRSGGASSLPVTPLEIAELTVTAPTAGFVLVQASMQAWNAATDGCPCQVAMRPRAAPGGEVAPQWAVSTVGNTTDRVSAGTTWVFPVAPGAQKFIVEAYRTSGTSSSLIAFAQITALFVPFAQNGGTTLTP